jgi:hypothetical protein
MQIDQELLLDIYQEIFLMREFEELLKEEARATSAADEPTDNTYSSLQGFSASHLSASVTE